MKNAEDFAVMIRKQLKKEIVKLKENASAGPSGVAGSPPVIDESVAKELEKLKADLATKVTELENAKMDKKCRHIGLSLLQKVVMREGVALTCCCI